MPNSERVGELPLVSIIIPTYNHRNYIAEAIDSALAQTYPRCEIIIVDDGSTDGTGDYLAEQFGAKITYGYQPNRGRGAARNLGLRLAKGEYIQFLDADDLIMPEKIASHVAFLEANPEYAAVYGHALVCLEDDLEHSWDWQMRTAYVSGDVLKQEIHKPFLLLCMLLSKSQWLDLVDGFTETLKSNEDWDLWLRIAHRGGQFAYLAGPPIAMYRSRRANPVAKASIHMQSGVLVLSELKRDIVGRDNRKRLGINSALGNWLFGYGRSLLAERRRLAGLAVMIHGLCLDRSHVDYKLASIIFGALMKPSRAEEAIQRLRKWKTIAFARSS